MIASLSPYRLRKARDLYNIFSVFNSISWQFLVGNIISLFALRLGANSTYIGILTATTYISFFFLPLGRILTGRFSMVKIFGVAWAGRGIGMLPVLFAPFVFAAGHKDIALLLTLLGVTFFHIIRGVGTIANNPVLSHLAHGPDRGGYMTQVQIINSAVGMFAGFIVAMLLGREPPLFLYAIIMALGIFCSILSGFIMFKIPGPESGEGVKGKKLFTIFREALTQQSLRRFIIILMLVALTSGVSRAFLVVYSREVFNQSDGLVSLYTVFGGFGNLIVGLLIKFLVDRIGAKPIFSVCVIMGLISMIPVVFVPVSVGGNFVTITLLLTFIFFLMNFGWLGSEGIMQTYFLGLIPAEQTMNMGILYFFWFGIAGAAGSLAGGVLLDAATAISASPVTSFRILYIILIAVSVCILYLMRRLVPLGALPFRGALEIMFSYRDLKAISILDKLNKTSDSNREEALLEALHDAPSRLSTKGLLHRARSPRLTVRQESIKAINALDNLSEDAESALMQDIINNPYTTAYISARTLGNHGVFQANALLRELVASDDYMLAGEAIIALSKLRDNAFRPRIEEIIAETKNPRLKIMGVEALGIYGSPDSLSVLLDMVRMADPPPYLRDEVVLAMASILDIQNKFYPLLVRFIADENLASTLAFDEAESAFEHYMAAHGRKRGKKEGALAHQAKSFQHAVHSLVKNSDGAPLCRWILELPDDLAHSIVQTVLSEAVIDDELMGHPRLRLLIVHWAAHELRLWTNKLKSTTPP